MAWISISHFCVNAQSADKQIIQALGSNLQILILIELSFPRLCVGQLGSKTSLLLFFLTILLHPTEKVVVSKIVWINWLLSWEELQEHNTIAVDAHVWLCIWSQARFHHPCHLEVWTHDNRVLGRCCLPHSEERKYCYFHQFQKEAEERQISPILHLIHLPSIIMLKSNQKFMALMVFENHGGTNTEGKGVNFSDKLPIEFTSICSPDSLLLNTSNARSDSKYCWWLGT